jgi:hypothetical protein
MHSVNTTNTPRLRTRALALLTRELSIAPILKTKNKYQQGVFVADDPLRPRLEPWRETAQQRAELLAVWKKRGVALASATVAYNLVN